MKTCFKCKVEKPLTEFYRHLMMADGYLNKCKVCTRADAKKNYFGKRLKYAAYERERFKRPERKAKVRVYQRTRRARHPEKARARSAVSRAVRAGRLIRQACGLCGATDRVQAHHDDYSKPLDIVWRCFKCHREEEHGQTVNA